MEKLHRRNYIGKFVLFSLGCMIVFTAAGSEYKWANTVSGSVFDLNNWLLSDGSSPLTLPLETDTWNGIPPYSTPYSGSLSENLSYEIKIPGTASYMKILWGNGSNNQKRNVTVDLSNGELKILSSFEIGGKVENGEYFSKYLFKDGNITIPAGATLKVGDWKPTQLTFSAVNMTIDGSMRIYSRSAAVANMITVKDGSKIYVNNNDALKTGDSSCYKTVFQVEGDGTEIICNNTFFPIDGVGSVLILKDGGTLKNLSTLRTARAFVGIIVTNTVYSQTGATWIGYGGNVTASPDWNGVSNNFLRVSDSVFDLAGKELLLYGEDASVVLDKSSILTNSAASGMCEIGSKASNTRICFDGARLQGVNAASDTGIRLCMSCNTSSGAEKICNGGSVSNSLLQITANPMNRVLLNRMVIQSPSRFSFDIPEQGWEEIPLEVKTDFKLYNFENRGKSRIEINVKKFAKVSKGETVQIISLGGFSGTTGAVADLMENEVYVDLDGNGSFINAKDLDPKQHGYVVFDADTLTLSYTAPKKYPLTVIIR